jgi:adenylate cyclase
MAFRIGVNLGDVIEKGDTIYGDGVNIAARLESLAEGGGICISGTAFDQIGKKVSLGYKYLGEQTVKNIEKPIRAYKVLIEPEAVGKVIGEKPRLKMWHWTAIFGLIVLIVVAGTLTFLEFYVRPDVAPASVEKMAYPLPDKPSIAVLPFVNMSGDPKQEFFSDAITEDIITALSKIPRLFVIARNSTFTYKGKPVKVKQVSEELGVRYVLEGSVQKSGDRVRITAQLIDALTGHHLWAERYERDPKDLFAVQDEVTIKVLNAMRVKLTEGEQAVTWEKHFRGEQGLECYFMVMEFISHFELFSIEGNNTARRIAEEIVAKWPENPWGYLAMGQVHWADLILGSTKSPRESFGKAMELAQKALAMDDSIPHAHCLLSSLYLIIREHDKALAEGERAVALDPGGAFAHEYYARSLLYAGRSEEAISIAQKAIRLNPHSTRFPYWVLGAAYKNAGRFEEAVSAYKKALLRGTDDILPHLGLANTYIAMGREKEARIEAGEVLRINPNFSLDNYAKLLYHKDQSLIDRNIDALRKAGLK